MTIKRTEACPQCGYSSDSAPLRVPLPKARIDNFLHTNDFFTEEEGNIFRSFIGNGQSKLNHFEARIISVKALLAELEGAKAELVKALSEQKRILNPMRRMPEDLLVEIFLHGAGIYTDPGEYFPSANHSLDLGSPPWTYSRVCRRWKEIAMRTPRVWTRVKINVNHLVSRRESSWTKSVNRLPLGLSLLSGYLGRSAALPLAVHLDISVSNISSSFNLDDHTLYGISVLMSSHSRRWETFFLGRGQVFDQIKSVFSDSFPLLKMLRIQEDMSTVLTVDIPAPNLKSWVTIGKQADLSRVNTTLSAKLYDQIRDYSISNLSYDAVLEMSSLLPRLRRLVVREFKPMSDFRLFLISGCFRGLQELVVEQSAPGALNVLQPFFNSITCPTLTSLSVIAHDSLKSVIQDFEKRSAFNLRHLDITRHTRILEGTLQNTAALKTLVVRDIGKAPDLSVADVFSNLDPAAVSLGSGSSSGVPFPTLHRLELHLCSSLVLMEYDTMEALFLCVSSRLNSSSYNDSVSPLEVFITAPDGQARKMLDHSQLRELRSLGIKVDIVAL
ncbi:hypothetical protein EV368DRAFT_84130 [Lentinula lateritia]|nr:hypothetical protein EV368DRAFT_84130 [Lentinula lateritia]